MANVKTKVCPIQIKICDTTNSHFRERIFTGEFTVTNNRNNGTSNTEQVGKEGQGPKHT
jgi:hypothetical protein